MGLDISVYANVSYVDPQPNEDDDWATDIFLYPNPSFMPQSDGLKRGHYDGERMMSFRAGSYSGYNEWREHLSRMALGLDPEEIWNQPEEYVDQPFFELIWFADNEGVIGPTTSAELLKDFEAFDERARQYQIYTEEELAQMPEPQREYFKNYFYSKYQEWKEAFRIASTNNGAVSFH